MNKRFRCVIAGWLLLMLCACTGGTDEPHIRYYRLAGGQSENYLANQACQRFCDMVRKETDGAIQILPSFDNELGTDASALEQCVYGGIDFVRTPISSAAEAAGVGALFSLILAIFYKQFSWKMLYESLIDTAKTSAMVFIILFGASAFTGIFMSLDGDQLIATWISSVGIGKWGAFAIMMAIVFFMGMFLDWLGIVMIVFPIFLPIMDMFGFDRLWIVAVTAVMLQTCFMTPPFGFALFYIKGIVPPSVKIQEIYRGVIPFILIIIAVVILVTVFPQVVYFLPNLVAS